MQHIPSAAGEEFEFVADNVAADFTNTLSGSRERPGTERIVRYADIVEFSRRGELIRAADAKRLLAEAERHPQKATEMYRRAIALREAIWRAFDRIAQDREPAAEDVAVIGDEAAQALASARVVRQGKSYAWEWPETDDLARPLWPIARSAADVLTSDEERARVRECASDTCSWIFVDRTKNGSRRWCDMRGCGNRAKVRAFRDRQTRASRRAR